MMKAKALFLSIFLGVLVFASIGCSNENLQGAIDLKGVGEVTKYTKTECNFTCEGGGAASVGKSCNEMTQADVNKVCGN